MRFVTQIFAALAFVVAGDAMAAPTNLVVNGEFENGLSGWVTPSFATPAQIEMFDGSAAAAFAGNPFEGGAAIYQNVGTIQAGTYIFTFKAENTNGFPTGGFVGVTDNAAGQAIVGGNFSDYLAGEWPSSLVVDVSFTGVVGANSSLIGKTLTVRFSGYSGDHIDNVSLTFASAVPEPEIYAMLLAGLGFVGAVARRRKAKQV
jgi:hypothetical protein